MRAMRIGVPTVDVHELLAKLDAAGTLASPRINDSRRSENHEANGNNIEVPASAQRRSKKLTKKKSKSKKAKDKSISDLPRDQDNVAPDARTQNIESILSPHVEGILSSDDMSTHKRTSRQSNGLDKTTAANKDQFAAVDWKIWLESDWMRAYLGKMPGCPDANNVTDEDSTIRAMKNEKKYLLRLVARSLDTPVSLKCRLLVIIGESQECTARIIKAPPTNIGKTLECNFISRILSEMCMCEATAVESQSLSDKLWHHNAYQVTRAGKTEPVPMDSDGWALCGDLSPGKSLECILQLRPMSWPKSREISLALCFATSPIHRRDIVVSPTFNPAAGPSSEKISRTNIIDSARVEPTSTSGIISHVQKASIHPNQEGTEIDCTYRLSRRQRESSTRPSQATPPPVSHKVSEKAIKGEDEPQRTNPLAEATHPRRRKRIPTNNDAKGFHRKVIQPPPGHGASSRGSVRDHHLGEAAATSRKRDSGNSLIQDEEIIRQRLERQNQVQTVSLQLSRALEPLRSAKRLVDASNETHGLGPAARELRDRSAALRAAVLTLKASEGGRDEQSKSVNAENTIDLTGVDSFVCNELRRKFANAQTAVALLANAFGENKRRPETH